MNWLLILGPLVLGIVAALGVLTRVSARLPKAGGHRVRSARLLRIPLALAVGLLTAAGFIMLAGALMPPGHTATRSARYDASPDAVWTIISDFPSHAAWQPGLKAIRRLHDRDGRPAWRRFGGFGPGIPRDIEIFELEISAFFVWLHMPSGKALVDAEHAMKDLDLEVEVLDPPRRMRTRVVDDDIPFGGAWTWDLSPDEGGCRVRITEQGFIEPAALRYLSRAFGHTGSMDEHLRALGQRLGGQIELEP